MAMCRDNYEIQGLCGLSVFDVSLEGSIKDYNIASAIPVVCSLAMSLSLLLVYRTIRAPC